jgi:APA family basic amino acid/polyamine antiporter
MSDQILYSDENSSIFSKKENKFFQAISAKYSKVDPHSYLRRTDESSFRYWTRRLTQIKPVELLWADAESSELKRALNSFQLIFIGIGAIIGKHYSIYFFFQY